MSGKESKRDNVLALVRGAPSADYVPAAFFLHFDPEFHRGEAAVRKHEEFFRFTGMDIVKIQFELPHPALEVDQPGDWAKMPRLGKDFYSPQVEVVRGLSSGLKAEALVVCTLYSPFMIAGQMGGEEKLIDHMEQDPDAVLQGLEIARDNLLVFVKEAVSAGLDGFYQSTQGGETRRFHDRTLFERYVKPIDLDVMHEVERECSFNILHVCDYNKSRFGGYEDMAPFVDYPGDLVSCPSEAGGTDAARLFRRPFMGGLDRLGVLATGTESEVRSAAREAIDRAPEAFFFAADCTVPPTTPWTNLKAAVDEAHKGR